MWTGKGEEELLPETKGRCRHTGQEETFKIFGGTDGLQARSAIS